MPVPPPTNDRIADTIALHAWGRWTHNGPNLTAADVSATLKTARGAAIAAFRDWNGVDTVDWVEATVSLLNRGGPIADEDADEDTRLTGT